MSSDCCDAVCMWRGTNQLGQSETEIDWYHFAPEGVDVPAPGNQRPSIDHNSDSRGNQATLQFLFTDWKTAQGEGKTRNRIKTFSFQLSAPTPFFPEKTPQIEMVFLLLASKMGQRQLLFHRVPEIMHFCTRGFWDLGTTSVGALHAQGHNGGQNPAVQKAGSHPVKLVSTD